VATASVQSEVGQLRWKRTTKRRQTSAVTAVWDPHNPAGEIRNCCAGDRSLLAHLLHVPAGQEDPCDRLAAS
jgi:hypothetical protein